MCGKVRFVCTVGMFNPNHLPDASLPYSLSPNYAVIGFQFSNLRWVVIPIVVLYSSIVKAEHNTIDALHLIAAPTAACGTTSPTSQHKRRQTEQFIADTSPLPREFATLVFGATCTARRFYVGKYPPYRCRLLLLGLLHSEAVADPEVTTRALEHRKTRFLQHYVIVSGSRRGVSSYVPLITLLYEWPRMDFYPAFAITYSTEASSSQTRYIAQVQSPPDLRR